MDMVMRIGETGREYDVSIRHIAEDTGYIVFGRERLNILASR